MKYSKKTILFNCACFMTDCSTCPLANLGCNDAPIKLLEEQALKNYLRMKKNIDWKYYNEVMTDNFGKHYANNFLPVKAKVV